MGIGQRLASYGVRVPINPSQPHTNHHHALPVQIGIDDAIATRC